MLFGKGQALENEFPRISRARMLNTIDPESSEIGDGTTSAPTEEEKRWFEIMKSTVPELEKIRKKLSVCAISEVVSYDKNHVTFVYDGVNYTINKPVNSLKIARAREYSAMSALEELNAQRCITIGQAPISKDFSGIDAEVIQLMSQIADKFFFMPFL
jgi:sugar phosphate isomerase/epimerase